MTDNVVLRMMEHFDLHDPAVAKDGVPQRVYSELREQCPIHRSDAHGGFWVASRYQDVERVIKDPETFASSLGVVIPDPTDALTPEDRQRLFEAGKGLVGPPVAYDPPAHTPIRRALEPLFGPGVVRQREDYIRSVADHWIDSFIEAGECDAVTQFCAPVPAIVVLNWLGLDDEDWKIWSDIVLEQFSRPGQYGPDISALDLEKILATLHGRRDNPTDDVLSAITQIRIDDEPLNDFEMVTMVAQLVLAGLDTTTNATAGTLVELHRRPELRAELAGTPHDDRLWVTAIEEFLRYTCPIQGFKRTARNDAEVGGNVVHPGERVLMLFASANFDEREFDRPYDIDIRRTSNRHMTFGRGIHRCLGSHLARLEVRVMVQQVLQRIPDYTIEDSKLEVHPDVAVAYGYESVPLYFTPRRAHG
jgi:cytochrome P450